MRAGLLIQYLCLPCGQSYYVDYVFDGRNAYFCPHCGKKNRNVGRYFAKDVFFEEEVIAEWETASPMLRTLIDYLAEHYPDGLGEDIFHDLTEAVLHKKGVETICRYEDAALQTLLRDVLDEFSKDESIKKA